nr:MAG: RNA-dependent RNA polymerase [Narnaviridae sp.]
MGNTLSKTRKMTDSERQHLSGANGSEMNLAGDAASLPKKAAAVLTCDEVEAWSRLTGAKLPTMGAPSWNALLVVDRHREILANCEALGPPLDLPLIDCFLKAAHMIHWYNNTVSLWAVSLISGDYGESYVDVGCKLQSSVLSVASCSKLLGAWTGLAQHGQLEKYLKWVTANFFAKCLLQKELPPAPPQFSGIFQKISTLRELYPTNAWRSIFRNQSSKEGRKWKFAFGKDVYMTKNASLPVEESFVKSNLEKHQEILCGQTTDKLSDDTYDEVCEAIQLCADEIFGKVKNTDSYTYGDKDEHGNMIVLERPTSRCPSRLPSFGASYHGKREDGGACGDLLRNYHDTGSLPEPDSGYLYGYAMKKGTNAICEVRTTHDPSLYFDAENEWSRKAYSLASEGVNAHVVPLIEPFKVRTITKGQAEIYHLARRWQKIIHRKMRQHPNFALIGQPCNGAFLSQIFGNSGLFDFEKNRKGFFVSGDYESATDLLNPALSEFAQEQISIRLGIPLEDQYVLKQCLTGHNLRYKKDGQTFTQTWGQLMGSPTSFPVLCLVNMAATLVSYQRSYKKRFHLSDLPICVNGDDVLFWSRDGGHYEIWKQITGECGLKFSLGKNYTSRDCCVINSELYLYNSEETMQYHRPAPLFRLEKAVNSRLLCGGTRSTASSGFDPLSLSDCDVETYIPAVGGPKAFIRKIRGESEGNYTLANAKKALRKLRAEYRSGDFHDDYSKWFNTLPSRAAGLLEQHDGEIERDSVVRPSMRKAITKVFNDLQVSRLWKFARADKRVVTNAPSYYLPQNCAGLGLIPAPDYRYSINDHLTALTLKSQPAEAHRYCQDMTPKMTSVSFMESVRAEIRELQDTLEIERALIPVADIESLRFNGEDEQFWELSFLTGFVDENNVVIDTDARAQREYDLNKILSSRNWCSRTLSIERAKQARRAIKDGLIEEKNISLGYGKSGLRFEGEWNGEEGTFSLLTGYHLGSVRPLPKFV